MEQALQADHNRIFARYLRFKAVGVGHCRLVLQSQMRLLGL